jgi:hypothetical protein
METWPPFSVLLVAQNFGYNAKSSIALCNILDAWIFIRTGKGIGFRRTISDNRLRAIDRAHCIERLFLRYAFPMSAELAVGGRPRIE